MRSTLVVVLALSSLALAQSFPPPGGGATPAGTTALDPNLGFYRLTYKGLPVGFVKEQWGEEQYNSQDCLHFVQEGNFAAKPDLLRDLPYTDFKSEVICNKETQDLQWASFTLSFPVQLARGAEASDFTLVQGQVRFMVQRRKEETGELLLFSSTDEDFQDAQLPLSPGEQFIFPDAVPKMLAGQLKAGKTLKKSTILLAPGLGTTRDAGRYVATLDAVVRESTKVKIGEEEVTVWPVLVTMSAPEGTAPATKVSLIDDKGVIRKAWTTYLEASKIQQFAEEPQDTIVYTRTATEIEAKEGLALVLSPKGRRDPFLDPRTPAIKVPGKGTTIARGPTGPTPEGPTVTPTEELKIEVAKGMVERAEVLKADIEKVVNLAEKATAAQQAEMGKWEKEVYEISAKIQGTKHRELRAQMAEVVRQVEELLKTKGNRYVIEAKTVANRIEEVFKNEEIAAPLRVSEITKDLERLKGISNTPGMRTPDKAEVDRLLQDSGNFLRRAKIRVEFDARKPEIRGVVVSSEQFEAPMRLGLVLFGRSIVIDTKVPLPRSKSSVILDVKGSKTGQRTHDEGQNVEGAGNMKVKRIERNKVAFEYEGEVIWVSTAR